MKKNAFISLNAIFVAGLPKQYPIIPQC